MQKEDLFRVFYTNINGVVKQVKIHSFTIGEITFITPKGELLTAHHDDGYCYGSGNIGGLSWGISGISADKYRTIYYNEKDAALLNENVVKSSEFFGDRYGNSPIRFILRELISKVKNCIDLGDGPYLRIYNIKNGKIHMPGGLGYLYVKIERGQFVPMILLYKTNEFEGGRYDLLSYIKYINSKECFVRKVDAENYLLNNYECERFEDEEMREKAESAEKIRKNLHNLVDEIDSEDLIYISEMLKK